MPVIKVTAEKRLPFRGGGELFTNVYHYQRSSWTTAQMEAAIAGVLAAERTVHRNDVVFTKSTAGPIGVPSEAFVTHPANTLGSASVASGHPELVVMAEWPIARNQTVRKFLHTMCLWGATDVFAPTTGFPAVWTSYLANARIPISGDDATLSNPSGQLTQAGAIDAFIRTHQMKQGRTRNLYTLGVRTPLLPGQSIR